MFNPASQWISVHMGAAQQAIRKEELLISHIYYH